MDTSLVVAAVIGWLLVLFFLVSFWRETSKENRAVKRGAWEEARYWQSETRLSLVLLALLLIVLLP